MEYRGIDGAPLLESRIATLEKMLDIFFPSPSSVLKILRLRSRKNVVLLLEVQVTPAKTSTLVAKIFVTDSFEKECAILKTSAREGLRVPEVLSSENGVILMEHVSGELLVDEINRTFSEDTIDELAEWYYNYHQIHNLTKGDPRLRNFILTPKGLCGLDFEEAEEGDWMLDIAGVSASLLDTDPINDQRKVGLCNRLLNKYLQLEQVDRTPEIYSHFNDVLATTLEQTAKWRDSSEILELSQHIRTHGLEA
jgi:tRNA A-37 threonylcarbamoyl transferase component Bud32